MKYLATNQFLTLDPIHFDMGNVRRSFIKMSTLHTVVLEQIIPIPSKTLIRSQMCAMLKKTMLFFVN
jgi:hypothetical protein